MEVMTRGTHREVAKKGTHREIVKRDTHRDPGHSQKEIGKL